MVVHSALPPLLEAAVAEELGAVHVAHGDRDPMAAAEAATADGLALIGPFTSRAVAEAVEATAPAGVPLIAPVATWAGVTRDDEPGCEDDPARHDGTVLRMVARDTEVAMRIAAYVRAQDQRALVIAGEHEYGVQLDGQLRLAGLPRGDDPDVVVLCGLNGQPEIGRARRGCRSSPSTASRPPTSGPTSGWRSRSLRATACRSTTWSTAPRRPGGRRG